MVTINGLIKGQWIQWLRHVMKRNIDALTKIVLNWKPEGKKPRGRPRKK